jgi:FAD/FMN-containing dehydrogenase
MLLFRLRFKENIQTKMSRVAQYLQEHLQGEVMTSADARRYFSTDASVFSVVPAMAVYPRNENDVRKTARFSWQLAERNRRIPITARGLGTDQSGAALGRGIILAFPAHMNKILEIDGKSGEITVEPGITFGKIQQALLTHGRFLPSAPTSMEYSTIGGAIANNAGGDKSYKYGTTRKYVKSLRVVLANGEVIETGRLSKRQLSKKLGAESFEGEIYRQLDTLLEEHHELIQQTILPVSKNAAGYALADVKQKDGSVDLTPLFVGSQGTLGVVTEAQLTTEVHNPNSTLVVALIDDLAVLQEVVEGITMQSEQPALVEMVDGSLLESVQRNQPALLKGVLDPPYPKVALFIEYDNTQPRAQKRGTKQLKKILKQHDVVYKLETEHELKEQLWRIRESVAMILDHHDGDARSLPIIEDGVVPVEKLKTFIESIYQLFKANNLQPAIWGHAGNGNLHIQPALDLAQVGDRQKMFKLLEEYYSLILSLGGTTTGQNGDGRLRAPYLEKLYGPDAYELLVQTKKIFDPYGILNPGVKVGVGLDDVKPLLRQEYSLSHLYDHLPRG